MLTVLVQGGLRSGVAIIICKCNKFVLLKLKSAETREGSGRNWEGQEGREKRKKAKLIKKEAALWAAKDLAAKRVVIP
jgi:hypothetical protein